MKGLVKIAPIVVIIACAASLFFAFKLSGIKTDLKDQKVSLDKDLASARGKSTKLQGDLDDSESKLGGLQKELAGAKGKLGGAEAELAQVNKTVEELTTSKTDLEKQLTDTKEELTKANEELKPLQEKVKTLDAQNTEELAKKVEAMTKEAEVMREQLDKSKTENTQLQEKVTAFKVTPGGTRGHVALTQDEWNLVVLDIGQDKNVRPETEFLLYRGDKLIAKARVTTVNQNNSVAELVPGFTINPPKEGDLAVIAKEAAPEPAKEM